MHTVLLFFIWFSIVHILQQGPVPKFILFICLYCICTLFSHLPHHSLIVNFTQLIQLKDAVIDGAECPTSSHSSTTVHHYRMISTRRTLNGLGLGLSNSKNESENAGTRSRDSIIWPCQEQEVRQSSLTTLEKKKLDDKVKETQDGKSYMYLVANL